MDQYMRQFRCIFRIRFPIKPHEIKNKWGIDPEKFKQGNLRN